jgi:Raffinose synthase or seed imbibition protein Sip1
MIETDTSRSTKYVHYMCILPLITFAIVGSLRGDHDSILLRFEHESTVRATGQVLISLGQKPISLLRETVAYQQSLHPPSPKPNPPPFPDHSADLYRGKLTYCTWNSLQPPTPTTATSIIRALESFPLMPNNVLIDDGWQTVENRQLAAFGAQPHWLDTFSDLGAVIRHIKSMGVQRVGVWHTVLGYWGGFSRSSPQFKNVPFLTLRKNWGATYPILHPWQAGAFFEAWYARLAEWGVDFVKCDDMAEIEDMDSCVDDAGKAFPLFTVRGAYVQAIRRNVERFFSGRIIWYSPSKPFYCGY